jgi:hypothetical protein
MAGLSRWEVELLLAADVLLLPLERFTVNISKKASKKRFYLQQNDLLVALTSSRSMPT